MFRIVIRNEMIDEVRLMRMRMFIVELVKDSLVVAEFAHMTACI